MKFPFDKREIEFAILDFSETQTLSASDIDRFREGVYEYLQLIDDRFNKVLVSYDKSKTQVISSESESEDPKTKKQFEMKQYLQQNDYNGLLTQGRPYKQNLEKMLDKL